MLVCGCWLIELVKQNRKTVCISLNFEQSKALLQQKEDKHPITKMNAMLLWLLPVNAILLTNHSPKA